MGKLLSLDLREWVMGFIDEGQSCNQAARFFRISIRSAIRIAGRKRATGSESPARQGRPRGVGKLKPFAVFRRAQYIPKFLIATIKAAPPPTKLITAPRA
jgi:transposase